MNQGYASLIIRKYHLTVANYTGLSIPTLPPSRHLRNNA